MRIVSWNSSRGAFEKKIPLVQALRPDLAVVQECARPKDEVPGCLWFGTNPRQGLAVLASDGWRVEVLPARPEVPDYIVPVQVTGPRDFLLLAVWAKRDRVYPYVKAVFRAV